MINTPAGWRQNSLAVFVGVCLPDVKSINYLDAKKQAWCGLQTGRNLLILAPKSFPLAGSYLIWMAFKTVDGRRSHRRGDCFAVMWQIKYRTIRSEDTGFVWLNLESIVTKKKNHDTLITMVTLSFPFSSFPTRNAHSIIQPEPLGGSRGYFSLL